MVIGALLVILWNHLQIIWADIHTLAGEEALREAKKYLGSGVQSATPFRNKSDPNHYIAALISEPIDTYEYPALDGGIRTVTIDTLYVALIVGSGGQYRRMDLTLGSIDGIPIQSEYGIVDANQDGYKEVYFVSASGGSGAFGVDVLLYNTKDRSISHARAGREYAIPILDVEIVGERNIEPLFEKWLLEKAKDAGNEYHPISHSWYTQAKHEWIMSNGMEFVDGYLNGKIFSKIPEDYQKGISCAINEGDIEWVSYFKGPVFCFNRSDDTYYVIYVPTSAYNSVQHMVSGREYLWLGLKVNDGILAFKKNDRRLRVFRVQGFMREDPSIWLRRERDQLLRDLYYTEEQLEREITRASLSIDESRLYLNVKGDQLTTYSGIVVFRDSLSSDEFQDALRCSYNDL